MTYREAYDRGREKLGLAGVEEADLEARILLEFVCGTTRNVLLAHGDRLLDIGQQEKYDMLIDRRKTRIPLQYLTGVQEFMGLTFTVNEQVLIPRQDTEILVEEALRSLHDGMRVLDMCTGSGCILISLLHYSNHCQGGGPISRRKHLQWQRKMRNICLAWKVLQRRTVVMEATLGNQAESVLSKVICLRRFQGNLI